MKCTAAIVTFTLLLLIGCMTLVEGAKLQAEHIRQIHQNARLCVKETGILPKNAFRVLSGDFSVDTMKAKCFVKCFLDKAGFIGDDGTIRQDVIREKLSVNIEPAKVNELLKKCAVEGEDVCDKAYQMYKCFLNNHKVPRELFQLRKGIGRRNSQQ